MRAQLHHSTVESGGIQGRARRRLTVTSSSGRQLRMVSMLVQYRRGCTRRPRSVCASSLPMRRNAGSYNSRGEIFEAAATDGALHDGQPVAAGHAEQRLRPGAAPITAGGQTATCGDDKAVVIWDCEARRPVRSCILDTIARCCALSPDGRHLAVGQAVSTGAGAGSARTVRSSSWTQPRWVSYTKHGTQDCH